MSIRQFARVLPACLIAGAAALSCSRDTTSPAARPQFDENRTWGSAKQDGWSGVLFCRAMPYAADTETIGPAGGSLHIGPHTLTIPPGALDAPVTIIGDAPSDTVRSVRLFPHGLEFDRDVLLTLSYAGCMSPPGQQPLSVVYTDDSLNVLYVLESNNNPFGKRVTAELEHFSRYAVGW